MPLTSTDIRAFEGLGNTITGEVTNGIYEGGAMAGFGPLCQVYSGPVHGSVKKGKISLAKPKHGNANGVFIRSEDSRVTFGRAVAGGFLVSDQFGGCDMTILKAPDGSYWGAHVYSSDACRAAVAATPAGWSTIGTWGSQNYKEIRPDCSALFVFTFFEGGQVLIVTVGGGGYPVQVRHVGIAAIFDA